MALLSGNWSNSSGFSDIRQFFCLAPGLNFKQRFPSDLSSLPFYDLSRMLSTDITKSVKLHYQSNTVKTLLECSFWRTTSECCAVETLEGAFRVLTFPKSCFAAFCCFVTHTRFMKKLYIPMSGKSVLLPERDF